MQVLDSELVHSTAVISADAEIDADVTIGPFAVIEGPVKIGPGTVIEAHAILTGPMELGRDNYIASGAVLGKPPQHRGYRGETTSVRIGDGNWFREFATVHRGTVEGGGVTVVGDRNYFMVGSHVGHDARVGNGCTLVNHAVIGGHVILMDHCILSGHSAIQQRTRVGRLAMVGGMGSSTKDIPPFILQQGYNCVSGLNLVGLRRAGFQPRTIDALRVAFRIFYKEGLAAGNALAKIEEQYADIPEVMEFVEFVRTSQSGVNSVREGSQGHPQRRL
jgi:UDP-N-acetylglucosamine acyltransferase